MRLVYLDPRPDGGKVGLDDFSVSGHVLAQLLGCATDTLKPGPDQDREFPYKETSSGLVYIKPTQNGSVDFPLANFTARIVSDIREDDG